MIGCVATSMFFVLIIWSIVVSENFKTGASSVSEAANSGLLPKASDFSLDQVLSGERALDTEQLKTGQEFLREQVENRSRPNFEDTGVAPKDDASTNDTEPPTVPPTASTQP